MASYILRNIDPDLWRRVKTQAASQVKVKTLIESLLKNWLNGRRYEDLARSIDTRIQQIGIDPARDYSVNAHQRYDYDMEEAAAINELRWILRRLEEIDQRHSWLEGHGR